MPNNREHPYRIRPALMLIGLLFSAFAASATRAAAITVNSLADGAPANDGQCTLREALLNANGNNQSGSTDCQAGSDIDTISFNVSGAIDLTSALPSITSSLTIDGSAAGALTVRRNATAEFRIFTIIEGNTVHLSGLTIANGKAVSGGGIQSQNATLTMTRCVVSGCTASGSTSMGFGGGLFILGGFATISESTISGNHAAHGGGVSVSSGSVTTITGSSITGNTTTYQAAGLSLQNSSVTITNSTISWNAAGTFPGGMTNYANAGRTASLALVNCTVAANTTGTAGRSIIDTLNAGSAATTQLNNTLVAGNTGANFSVSGTNAAISSQGNNLDSDGSSGFVNGTNGDQAGTAGSLLDAKLGPLADNGGPTRTHALLTGSPAIDAGAAAGVPSTDQRGQPRVGPPDIGAYEYVPGGSQTTSTTTSSSTTTTTTSTSTTSTSATSITTTTSSSTSTTLPCGNQSAAQRILPAGYTAGQPSAVGIRITPLGTTQSYAVEEMLPAGWTVSGIDTGGRYDSVNGKIQWGPYLDHQTRTLRYSVTPPAGSTGIRFFSGIATLDGSTQAICGNAIIAGVTLDFPQVAAGGGYRAFLVLNNPSSSATVQGTVSFRRPDGLPLTLQLDNNPANSQSFNLPARGSVKLALTDQETQIKTGWCQVTATGTLGGVLTYQLLDGEEILSQASVPPSARMRGFTMAVPQMGGATDSGLAIANMEDQPAQATLRFWMPNGTMAAEASLTLKVGEQIAAFVSQIFPTLQVHQEGTVELVSDRNLVAVGLLYAGSSFATLPVLPLPF